MRWYLSFRAALWTLTLACFCLGFVVSANAVSDLQQHLSDVYQGKTLILRGFYSGDHLEYDSSGHVIGATSADDWTVAGVVQITSLSLSGARVEIKARRLYLGWPDGAFQELRDYDQEGNPDKDEEKNRSLIIEDDLGTATALAADRVLSQIFLNGEDNFADLVPAYWKSCVLSAITGRDRQRYSSCQFSRDFLAIPGVAHTSAGSPQSDQAESQQSESSSIISDLHPGSGVSPPRMIHTQDPTFSEQARRAGYRGRSMLRLVVDRDGNVRDIRIDQPLGGGLDPKAVEAVWQWRFLPARKDGKPVAVEIAVQIDFRR